jgi:2-oxoglutarate dehydrogenase E1 component
MAFDYRQEFKKDVVIDMFCYRRYGHNEADDPAYTQPILYRKIKEHPSVTVIFGERLVRDSVLSAAEVEQMRKHAIDRYAQAFDSAQKSPQKFEPYHLGSISLEQTAASSSRAALDISKLQRTVEALTTFPEGFTYHPKLKGFIEKRKQAFAAGGPIDWAFAEALAFGTLALGGTPVRLSGQDSGRGTFSQRHLVFYDYENGQRYMPLKHLAPDQANFDVFDSSLSEYAVVGFEFGYSVADPQTLTMWEAQFGDFANGAQIVIDQFITTAESKWGQPSGLVMLLPHGFEGQGPEHSSARIERFLTLCAEDNLQVINCTTPAQYFHVLRRQRGKRKPLIIFTPKGILRDPRAVSTFDELLDDRFHEVLDDSTADPAQVKRLIFSAGKVYYDLLAAREKAGAHHVALARLEQIYPFAHDQVDAILKRYPAAELVWVQEEPRNMGAWRFIYGRFHRLLEGSGRALRYIGRPLSSSPASGSAKRHAREQSEILTAALA